jgi:hypothetical protein
LDRQPPLARQTQAKALNLTAWALKATIIRKCDAVARAKRQAAALR